MPIKVPLLNLHLISTEQDDSTKQADMEKTQNTDQKSGRVINIRLPSEMLKSAKKKFGNRKLTASFPSDDISYTVSDSNSGGNTAREFSREFSEGLSPKQALNTKPKPSRRNIEFKFPMKSFAPDTGRMTVETDTSKTTYEQDTSKRGSSDASTFYNGSSSESADTRVDAEGTRSSIGMNTYRTRSSWNASTWRSESTIEKESRQSNANVSISTDEQSSTTPKKTLISVLKEIVNDQSISNSSVQSKPIGGLTDESPLKSSRLQEKHTNNVDIRTENPANGEGVILRIPPVVELLDFSKLELPSDTWPNANEMPSSAITLGSEFESYTTSKKGSTAMSVSAIAMLNDLDSDRTSYDDLRIHKGSIETSGSKSSLLRQVRFDCKTPKIGSDYNDDDDDDDIVPSDQFHFIDLRRSRYDPKGPHPTPTISTILKERQTKIQLSREVSSKNWPLVEVDPQFSDDPNAIAIAEEAKSFPKYDHRG
jgi:hypothetical protein